MDEVKEKLHQHMLHTTGTEKLIKNLAPTNDSVRKSIKVPATLRYALTLPQELNGELKNAMARLLELIKSMTQTIQDLPEPLVLYEVCPYTYVSSTCLGAWAR